RRDVTPLHWRVRPAVEAGGPPSIERVRMAAPPGFHWLSVSSNILTWTTSRGTQQTPVSRPRPRPGRWSPTAPGINGVSPDGRWLGIFKGYTSNLFIYRLPQLTPVARLDCGGFIAGFQFSPDGGELVVSSRGQMEFWNTARWERERALPDHAGI